MHMSQSLFYLTTALHVSGVTITHFQEHKTTVTTAFGNVYTVIHSFISIQPLGRFSRNQNPVRRPVWLWYAASWANS